MLSRLVLVVLCCVAVPVQAQPLVRPDTTTLDVRLLRTIYASPPGVASVWRAADGTSYPVFLGAPAAAWGAVLAGHAEAAFAFRLTLAEGAAMVSYYGLKNVIRRQRPYRRVPGIASRRSLGSEELESLFDPYSFPSGHAAVAFAVATTLALESGRWYVVVPGAVWATSVALSRVWLGVHYPSDVFVGSLLGAGAAVAVYILADAVTPAPFRDDPAAPAVSVMALRVRWEW